MPHRKAPKVRSDAPGMRGQRSRTEDGALRQKRGDTHAGAIEEQYHINLGVRRGKKLSNVLKDEGVDTLSDILKKKQ